MMNSIQKGLFALIKRSKCDQDGWYSVSGTVWPLIDGALPAELVELEKAQKAGAEFCGAFEGIGEDTASAIRALKRG